MSARYAVYHAPARDHPLTALASAWLGYDAWTATPAARPVVDGLTMDAAAVEAATDEPRRYGFHATLKAPFELAEGRTEAALVDGFRAFAATQPGFAVELALGALSGFVALMLAQPSAAMGALHAACVHGFEPFRAPLSGADLARRRRAPMTAEQDARLMAFGYPWIFEDFRFHMTLTGRIADPAQRDMLVAALARHFGAVTGAYRVEMLCLFRQPDRQAPFHILASSPLS
jgi:2'-5' RNA ligase